MTLVELIQESRSYSLTSPKAREQHLRPEEIAAVEAALEAHPKTQNYRLDVKPERLVIYERVSPDADALFEAVAAYGGIAVPSDLKQRLRDDMEHYDPPKQMFPGARHVDGTIEGALRAAMEAYP
jgi:hypothetical protein